MIHIRDEGVRIEEEEGSEKQQIQSNVKEVGKGGQKNTFNRKQLINRRKSNPLSSQNEIYEQQLRSQPVYSDAN